MITSSSLIFRPDGDTCVMPARATPRSARKETRNPLLSLPAFQELQSLPPASRHKIRAALLSLSVDAGQRAEHCWRKSKAPMATYWKAVSVYAKHTARLLK
jgi:hypothetical protein